MFPGNTADVKAFERVVQVLRQRLKVRKVVVVADRGMISRSSIGLLTGDKESPYEYVLGCRMRRNKEVGQHVLTDTGGFETVAGNLSPDQVNAGGSADVPPPRRYVDRAHRGVPAGAASGGRPAAAIG
jgi:hypothetical protein